MTGLTAGGFLSLTGPLAPRVVVAASPQFLKSALRDWLSLSYGKISITVISHLRWLFLLWCLRAPPFPRKRGHYKAPLCCELLMKGLLFRVLLSHRFSGGKVVAPATKGGMTEWYMKYMTLCFSPQISCFPLRGNAT